LETALKANCIVIKPTQFDFLFYAIKHWKTAQILVNGKNVVVTGYGEKQLNSIEEVIKFLE